MKIFKYIWKIKTNLALFIASLVVLLVCFYSIRAIADFYAYKKAVDPKFELTTDRFHFFLKNELNKEYMKLAASAPLVDEKSSLKTFRISVKQKDLESLNADLPRSGKDHYVDALMSVSDTPGKIFKVKMRYRGDQINHWLFDSKSLRIKLSKNDVYDMHKKFNLINPPMISTIIDVINYKEAKKLGLVAPDFYPVRVFVNGKYKGVSFFLSQIDESLMRKFKRMPGSIYRGDNSSLNKADKHGVSNLFRDERVWEKVAARNAEQKKNRDDIEYYIKEINNKKSTDFYNFFNNYLDKDKYYNFFALDVIFGTNHHDYTHNHYIYFDPYKGKFEPIEWDLRFWTPIKIKDASVYPLLNQLKLNPLLEAQRDKTTYNIIKNNFYSKISTLLDKESKQIETALASDFLKNEASTGKNLQIIPAMFYSTPYSLQDFKKSNLHLKEVLKMRKRNLMKIYNDTKVVYSTAKNNGYTIITFSINGNSPTRLLTHKNLYRDMNFNEVLDENDTIVSKSDIIYPGRKWVDGAVNNWPKIQYGYRHLINSNLIYQYIVKDNNFSIDDLKFYNTITGQEVIAHNGIIKDDTTTNSIHPWKLPQPNKQTKVFSGIVHITKTLEFDKYTSVVIKPNTTFVMDANKSIYFYGKVTALGTKEKPIKFVAKDPTKPWGLVAVQGKATTGSKFSYVEFENGSVDTHNLIHYTAPFNIHDMDWFEVRHCKIGKNFVGDDSMHIAYSKGIVDSCLFHDARSDGLDVDISDVNITNNIFYKSGNDCLDVMTTTMNVSNNVFIDSGDKGISVGEWSDANITDSFFLRTGIGVEIKDKSKVRADNLVIVDSKEKAINLYNKNKRYDTGGFLTAGTIYLLGNTKVKADKRSSYKIEHELKGKLPNLTQFQWYKDIQNTPYFETIKNIEVQYAK